MSLGHLILIYVGKDEEKNRERPPVQNPGKRLGVKVTDVRGGEVLRVPGTSLSNKKKTERLVEGSRPTRRRRSVWWWEGGGGGVV